MIVSDNDASRDDIVMQRAVTDVPGSDATVTTWMCRYTDDAGPHASVDVVADDVHDIDARDAREIAHQVMATLGSAVVVVADVDDDSITVWRVDDGGDVAERIVVPCGGGDDE